MAKELIREENRMKQKRRRLRHKYYKSIYHKFRIFLTWCGGLNDQRVTDKFLQLLDEDEREFWNNRDEFIEKLVTSCEVSNLPEGE